METISNLNEVLRKLDYYSTNNLIWTLYYSGCGLPYFFNDKEISHINSLCDDDKDFIENLMPIRCLYKKAKAAFSKAPHEILNAGKYVWDFESFDKEINVQTQVFSVLSMILLLKDDKSNNKTFTYVTNKQIKNFIDFLTAYMRNKDGLFVDVVDKTRYLNEELKIKQEKDIKLLNQFYAFELTLAYTKFLENNNSNSQVYKNDANSLFKFIFENFNSVLDLTTREISLISSSLYRSSFNAFDEAMLTSINELVALSCAEIESRVKINGEVEKSSSNYTPSSIITHFRAISSLLEGYNLTKIEKFKLSAQRIMSFILDLFDEDAMLFNTIDTEYKYSIRDIAEVIKCLLLCYDVFDKEILLDILKKFFTSSIENSGIVQAVVDNSFSNYRIPLYSDVNLAPVFLRSFNFKKDLLSQFETSNSTNLYYSIYASYIMLTSVATLKIRCESVTNEPKEAFAEDVQSTEEIVTVDEDKIEIA